MSETFEGFIRKNKKLNNYMIEYDSKLYNEIIDITIEINNLFRDFNYIVHEFKNLKYG